MNMVWHDCTNFEFKTRSGMERHKGPSHYVGNLRPAQPAIPMTGIQVFCPRVDEYQRNNSSCSCQVRGRRAASGMLNNGFALCALNRNNNRFRSKCLPKPKRDKISAALAL